MFATWRQYFYTRRICSLHYRQTSSFSSRFLKKTFQSKSTKRRGKSYIVPNTVLYNYLMIEQSIDPNIFPEVQGTHCSWIKCIHAFLYQIRDHASLKFISNTIIVNNKLCSAFITYLEYHTCMHVLWCVVYLNNCMPGLCMPGLLNFLYIFFNFIFSLFVIMFINL